MRAVPIWHEYRVGDMVRLDPASSSSSSSRGGEEQLVKCLGAPKEGRTGCVISAGCVRKGIQRNIEVACVDQGGGGGIVVSLYSAAHLLPGTNSEKCSILCLLPGIFTNFSEFLPALPFCYSHTSDVEESTIPHSTCAMMADDQRQSLIQILTELSQVKET